MPKLNSQKILDIVPPKKVIEKIQPKKDIERREPSRVKARGFPKMIVLVVIFLLILAGGTFYFIFQKAEIVVWPKTQVVNFQEKLTVDVKTQQIDLSSNAIPGTILKEEQKTSQEFPSSGRTTKEARAKGIIRVYNAYSTDPQVLVATTRFVSADGKLFRSSERVTIPGGSYQGGKLQPGFLDIEAEADQPGEEYNIGPSTFSIPGFAGTARYTAFYGKSSDPMKGGFKGETFEVVQKDLNDAENSLKAKLLEAVRVSLTNKVSEEIIILDEAAHKEFSIPVFSAKPGEERVSFVADGAISFEALVFNKSDLENFVKNYINSQISKEQELNLKSLKIDYSLETASIDQGKMILNLEITAQIHFKISEKELKEEIMGKPLSQAEEFLAKDPRIAKLEINLWPFWVKKVPQAEDRIKIEQRID